MTFGLIGLNALTWNEPTFQGKSVRYWMNYDYRPPHPDLEFQKAWKNLEANTVPFLVKSLDKTDPPLPHVSYRNAWSSLPPWLQAVAPQPGPPAQVVRSRAASALGIIGETAKPAIPALRLVMESNESTFVREVAKDGIKKINPEAASQAAAR